MAQPGNDPQGIALARINANAQLVVLSSAIANYCGDANGLEDLKVQQARVSDLLNLSSTRVGTAYSGFGLGGVST